MNRIIQHLRCPNCVSLPERDRLRTECERIEALAEKVVDFWLPCEKEWKAGERTVRLIVDREFNEAAPGDDLASFYVRELRELAHDLMLAADRVEGQVSQ
ncbi:MAG TPA: hypothetical protein VGM05_33160 [Planctomycetaceae bacterium]|jgi:hypothetical protein